MRGSEPIASPRTLSLDSLTDYSGGMQFEGNGSAAYPPLFDREVFGFFPFQVNAHRFVVPVYVMTRNVVKNYSSGSASPTRFDMPPERYRLAISGVVGTGAEVSATDPLTGGSVPVEVVSRSSTGVVVELGVTDSPRLITIQEDPSATLGEPEPSPSPEEPAPAPEPTPIEETSTHGKGKGGGGGGKKIRLQLRASAGLLQRGELSATATCLTPCRPAFRGRLRAIRRAYPMRPVSPAQSLGSQVTVRLKVSKAARRAAWRALEKGKPVRAAVQVYAPDDQGAALTARRTLLLRR
jgi:hypothetical protein